MQEKKKVDEKSVRIQKYISDCGIMSRRAAEKEISEGRITVNGIVAVIGDKILPEQDEIKINGFPLLRKKNNTYQYIALNKPIGYVTTLSDEYNRKCVAQLVSNVGVRVNPAGRLDMNSEGLLIFTNDGEMINRLTHPRYSLPKTYIVQVDRAVTENQLKRLRSPMEIDGYTIKKAECKIIHSSTTDTKSVLEFVLHEGRNRQIRKMCEIVGLNVINLCRISIGKIELGNLPSGKWRYLSDSEVNYIKKETGMLG